METKIGQKVNQNCTDFSSVQDIETMLACIVRFLGSANLNMLTKIFKGAKGVAIATKFTHTKTKMHRFQFCTRYIDNFYVLNMVFGVVEFKDVK